MAKTSPLHKVTDDNLWDAEYIFGRLCIVAHAAFLYEGFLPHGAPTTTAKSLSRGYSLPQQDVEEEDHVVLRLYRPRRRHGERSRLVLHTYYDTGQHAQSTCLERRVWLERAAVSAVLSGGLDDTVRTLRTPGSSGQWLWKLIADGICRGLFLDMCRKHGVPVEPGFASLPVDLKVLILSRLDSAKDIAMAECASKELRDLAAEHDQVVWKDKCDRFVYYDRYFGTWLFWKAWCGDLPNMTWKQKYITIRKAPSAVLSQDSVSIREATTSAVPEDPRELVNVAANVGGKAAGRTNLVAVQCNGYRRRHGAGAVHSPSSRYRWRHR